ncbi:MAG TPA: ABC transporter permease [Candidatus Saccharimonadales bacterium]|nr:ABC transporter permease [Candidatus Saccharimonadales bacterium]
MFEYFKIALRSLLRNKVRSILTMVGIIIGVGAVIILTSIVGGLKKTITKQFESFGSNNLYVFPGTPGGGRGPGGAVVNKLTFSMEDQLKQIRGVTTVSAAVINVGNIKYLNKDSKNVTINGTEDNFISLSSLGLLEGRYFSRSEYSGGRVVAVIGPKIKEKLYGKQTAIGKEVIIKDKKFTVVGVLEPRGAIFGVDQDTEVYIPLTVSRQRFQIDRPNFFFVKVGQTENIGTVQHDIIRVISRTLDESDFSVISQDQSLQFINTVLGVLAAALGGIAAISLIVGGVGIMNIMFVSVTERTREIGLRKAIGASSHNILSQFLLEAVILSLLGGLIGVLFGILSSALLGKFIDTQVNFFYVAISFVVSAAIGIIFGVAPAIKASKLDPIVALRYE